MTELPVTTTRELNRPPVTSATPEAVVGLAPSARCAQQALRLTIWAWIAAGHCAAADAEAVLPLTVALSQRWLPPAWCQLAQHHRKCQTEQPERNAQDRGHITTSSVAGRTGTALSFQLVLADCSGRQAKPQRNGQHMSQCEGSQRLPCVTCAANVSSCPAVCKLWSCFSAAALSLTAPGLGFLNITSLSELLSCWGCTARAG